MVVTCDILDGMDTNKKVNYWTTCGAGCGKKVWHSKNSSSDRPFCRECRKVATASRNAARDANKPQRAKPELLSEILCNGCGNMFVPPQRRYRVCSRVCAGRVRQGWINGIAPEKPEPGLPNHTVTISLISCVQCKGFFLPSYPRHRICSDACRKQRSCDWMKDYYHDSPDRKAVVIFRAQQRRADKLGVDEIIYRCDLIAFIRDRDGDECKLCGVAITNGPFEKYDSLMPSIDHKIPLARGGKHHLDNLQLTHLRCNLSKCDRLDSEVQNGQSRNRRLHEL